MCDFLIVVHIINNVFLTVYSPSIGISWQGPTISYNLASTTLNGGMIHQFFKVDQKGTNKVKLRKLHGIFILIVFNLTYGLYLH